LLVLEEMGQQMQWLGKLVQTHQLVAQLLQQLLLLVAVSEFHMLVLLEAVEAGVAVLQVKELVVLEQQDKVMRGVPEVLEVLQVLLQVVVLVQLAVMAMVMAQVELVVLAFHLQQQALL
jgi:hypothetical protein